MSHVVGCSRISRLGASVALNVCLCIAGASATCKLLELHFLVPDSCNTSVTLSEDVNGQREIVAVFFGYSK